MSQAWLEICVTTCGLSTISLAYEVSVYLPALPLKTQWYATVRLVKTRCERIGAFQERANLFRREAR